MTEADREALAAWKAHRAAQDMLTEASALPGLAPFVTATRIAHEAYNAWVDALGKARAPLDVATLKGGR